MQDLSWTQQEGVEQTSGFAVTASQLGMVQFVAGSQAATDPVYLYAHDGKTWSDYSTVTLTTQVINRAPVVKTYNQTVNRGESIIPDFTVTDADGDTINPYALYDGNTHANSGYFTIAGVKQEAGQILYVKANQLSQVDFVGGASAEHIAEVEGKYHWFTNSSVAAAIAAFTAGSAVFFSSDKNQHGTLIGSDKLVGGHAYLLTSYDSVNKTVTSFNPWNSGNSSDKDGYLTVSWDQVPTYFYAWREAS